MTSLFIGVDIGGTFTDCAMVKDDGRISTSKVLSTHATTPADGVMAGLELLASENGLSLAEMLAQTERLSHGATIGTNLVVERNGANVALIATRGHGDAVLIMRGQGRTAGLPADRLFNAHSETMPVPLVPRHRIVEVSERIAADGEILAALDEDAARTALAEILADGSVEAVAVALLWSIANPVHELRLRELVHEIAPDMFVSLSCEVSPRQGEYERTVAAVINSYVGPASCRYLQDLSDRLAGNGLRSPLYVVQASGGVVPVDEAMRRPLHTIGSGPAGGLAGTMQVARNLSHRNVIATDMGGTSFEVGLVIDGQPTMASQQVLAKFTYYSTHLDLRSIACGGGSVAYVDPDSGGLRVGPRSAGSTPGPACYGTGTEATVTDADVVLGLLDPETFLGGHMQLDAGAARAAVGRVARQLCLSVEETAAGIVRVNAHAAATLIRQRTIEQGLDPRDFTLYAFGGAGPLHAFAYASELGVERVVIPLGNGASTLSAYGGAVGDLIRSFERPIALVSPYDPAVLGEAIGELEKQSALAIGQSAFTDDVAFDRTASMRYTGQKLQELTIQLPDGPVDERACAEMERRFTADYRRLYSAAALALFQSIEIFNLRVTARAPARVPLGPATREAPGSASPQRFREVYWPGSGWRPTAVFFKALQPGETAEGPAIVELGHTAIGVAPGQYARAGHDGTITLARSDHQEVMLQTPLTQRQ
jgi:N-methylhydantoinase A